MKNILCLVVLLGSTWRLGNGSCSDESIAICAQPLAAFNLSSAPIVPTRSEDEMRSLCKAYDVVEDCLLGIGHDCDNKKLLKMKTVDLQYEYICDQKFDEYLKHRECLSTPKLHDDAGKCNVTLTQHYDLVRNSNRSNSYKREKLCQYVYQYINCIHFTVRVYCSVEAAEWQMGLDMVTALPAFSTLNCPIFQQRINPPKSIPAAASESVGSGGTPTHMIIVAVIVVGVVCLVLVGSMTALFIHRKRRADRKRAADEMLHITRRNPRSHRASQPSSNYAAENPASERNDATTPSDFYAPPPYLAVENPPPSYRNPPNYDAIFSESEVGATGQAVNDLPVKEKIFCDQ